MSSVLVFALFFLVLRFQFFQTARFSSNNYKWKCRQFCRVTARTKFCGPPELVVYLYLFPTVSVTGKIEYRYQTSGSVAIKRKSCFARALSRFQHQKSVTGQICRLLSRLGKLACGAGTRRSWDTRLLIWLGRTGSRAELRLWWLQTRHLLSTDFSFCLVLTVDRAIPEDWLGVSLGYLSMNYSFDTRCILSFRISWYSVWYIFLDALIRIRFSIVVSKIHWSTQTTFKTSWRPLLINELNASTYRPGVYLLMIRVELMSDSIVPDDSIWYYTRCRIIGNLQKPLGLLMVNRRYCVNQDTRPKRKWTSYSTFA